MSRSLRFASFALVSSVLSLLACGSDEAERDAAAESAFFDAYARAVCDDAAPCCAQVGAAHDAAACRALVGAALREVLGPKKGTFVPEAGERLVSAIRQEVAACAEAPFNSAAAADQGVNFAGLYEPNGTRPPGAACDEPNDCAPAAGARVVCMMESALPSGAGEPVVSGKCLVLRPPAEDMSCDDSMDADVGDCDFDSSAAFYCDASDKRCHARRALGERCGGSDECVRGARCTDGTCASPSALDEPCGSDFDCAEGLYCDHTSKGCATLKRGGEACSSPDECLSTRCDDGSCRVLSYLTADTCGGR
ncbi:MAG: hypothetical protein KF894_23470 [Labilithrix sp.]|nr:hypothetical protein [Labilithrix sp.]